MDRPNLVAESQQFEKSFNFVTMKARFQQEQESENQKQQARFQKEQETEDQQQQGPQINSDSEQDENDDEFWRFSKKRRRISRSRSSQTSAAKKTRNLPE
eukprot:TRINITY_DN10070_c0_g1_i1.p2 TRINITY_DN10070_c0_g1~~TRINITY_DN10070_c0_g1_i1.p2  ORF type:complete len:100 (-),score=25.76 TRINITY_DN10070_c0_g1_i1:102-401(-)